MFARSEEKEVARVYVCVRTCVRMCFSVHASLFLCVCVCMSIISVVHNIQSAALAK